MSTAPHTSTRLQRFYRGAMTSHQAAALPTGGDLRLPPALASIYDQLAVQIGALGEYRDLVIDVLRTEAPIEQFIKVPASLQHHHCTRGGLLTHTLEVVSNADALCRTRPHARRSLVLAAAFLHDIGKCHEYMVHDRTGKAYRTEAGSMAMHKVLGVMMITRAAARVGLADHLLQQLVHCVTAAPGPDYMGLARPRILEHAIVQQADALSACTLPSLSAPNGPRPQSARVIRFGAGAHERRHLSPR